MTHTATFSTRLRRYQTRGLFYSLVLCFVYFIFYFILQSEWPETSSMRYLQTFLSLAADYWFLVLFCRTHSYQAWAIIVMYITSNWKLENLNWKLEINVLTLECIFQASLSLMSYCRAPIVSRRIAEIHLWLIWPTSRLLCTNIFESCWQHIEKVYFFVYCKYAEKDERRSGVESKIIREIQQSDVLDEMEVWRGLRREPPRAGISILASSNTPCGAVWGLLCLRPLSWSSEPVLVVSRRI